MFDATSTVVLATTRHEDLVREVRARQRLNELAAAGDPRLVRRHRPANFRLPIARAFGGNNRSTVAGARS